MNCIVLCNSMHSVTTRPLVLPGEDEDMHMAMSARPLGWIYRCGQALECHSAILERAPAHVSRRGAQSRWAGPSPAPGLVVAPGRRFIGPQTAVPKIGIRTGPNAHSHTKRRNCNPAQNVGPEEKCRSGGRAWPVRGVPGRALPPRGLGGSDIRRPGGAKNRST